MYIQMIWDLNTFRTVQIGLINQSKLKRILETVLQ